jgi:ATP-dependent DNA ligase I
VTLLSDVVRTSTQVSGTPSRLAKVRELADCLGRLEPDEIRVAIPYLSGEIRQGKLSLGYASLHSARAARALAPTLTLLEVDRAFDELKAIKGKGAAARREKRLAQLFERASAQEQDFLARLIVGELRQGALEGVMLEAVAAAAELPAAEVRRAASVAGGIAQVAEAALTGGATALERFSIRLMQPVLPMLAQPARDIEAALAALGTAILEWKLDGARVQVHKSGDEVRVFTRNLNDVTAAVPEIVAAVREVAVRSLILDGEVIALRPDGRPHPFQVTMRRFGRKLGVAEVRGELPLSVFFFDCLLRDGEPLVDKGGIDRRKALEAAVAQKNLIVSIVTADKAQAAAFYADALARGHEGVMAKALDAPYEAGRRGAGWLKVKRAHTLDLVVLAAEWGHGRRRGWLSNLHLGARDPASGGFVMLGKTFKGLTDELLEWQTREILARETGRDDWTVRVRPELVVEIAFNDLQESRHYPGGLALRFARVKGYRPDKSPADADTIETVRRIYEESLS